MSPVKYTKITLRNIPAAPREIYHFTERRWTWDQLLKKFLVNLDPADWTIYDKSTRMYARLDDPIWRLVNRRRQKKNTMSVIVRKVRKVVPTPDSTGDLTGIPQQQHNHPDERVYDWVASSGSRSSKSNSDGHGQSGYLGNDEEETEEIDEQFEIDGFLLKKKESQKSRSRPQQCSEVTSQSKNMVGNMHSSSDYEHERIDNEDDSMSQFSQEEDEGNDHGKYIKQELINSIQGIPTGELRRMKEELVQLKRAGNSREYKWIHYAPRTSSFIMSAFRA